MREKLISLMLLVLIFIAFIFGNCFAAKKLDIDYINFTVDAIRTNYIHDVDVNKLLNGGISNLKKYLVFHKKDASYIKDLNKQTEKSEQIAQITEYINKAVNDNPDLNKEEILYSFIDGIVNSLEDPFSIFMTPKEYKKLIEQMEGGNFGGLGVYIELDPNNNKALTITKPIENTPAYQAGLQTGDVITKISGKSTKDMTIDESQAAMRGKVGTKVTLTIFRKKENRTFDITLTRAIIHTKSAAYKVIDDIGYIKIEIFGENTSNEIEEALNYFDDKKVKGYILDLRNNGGGYIDSADSICSKFMPTDSLITMVKSKFTGEMKHISYPNSREMIPMVVLVNQYSASASEITAGALKSINVPLVGEKTFGKATIQKIMPYPDGSALKLTVASYFTPDGKNINKVGIEPDVIVKMEPDLEGLPGDIQFEKALEILKNKLNKV